MSTSQNLTPPPQESPDHPSQSIPNAAYPDTPYQPGSGYHGNASTPVSTSLATSVTGNNTSSYSASPTTSPNQSAANTGPSSWHQAAPLSTSIPDIPPPPYVRHEQSSPYIPAQTRPASHWTGTQSNRRNEQPDAVPLQSLSLAASSQGSRAPAASISQHDQLPSAYTTGSGSITASTQTGKLGPVAEARRRRRRRVKICIVLLAAAILFVLALIIGIALGVIKNAARNNRNDGPNMN